jgi:hypothetical protein
MKPWDTLGEDGQLYSGALGRRKAHQHPERTVIQWQHGRWVIVRRPLM